MQYLEEMLDGIGPVAIFAYGMVTGSAITALVISVGAWLMWVVL